MKVYTFQLSCKECEGCKARDEMIARLADRIDEVEKGERATPTNSKLIAFKPRQRTSDTRSRPA